MSSPAWPTYDDWCAEVKHVKESWKTEHKDSLERDGDLIVTTKFGSQWSVDSWASHLLAIGGKGCKNWFNERDHNLRLSWYRPLRDQDGSMDIYSSKFPSFERMRGNHGTPPRAADIKGNRSGVEHWLQPIVAQDLKRLSSDCSSSLPDQLDSKEWSRMAQEQLEKLDNLNLKGRPQYARLQTHVLARLKKNMSDDGIQRQTVAGLEAIVTICQYANVKGLGATMLQFYMPSNAVELQDLVELTKNVNSHIVHGNSLTTPNFPTYNRYLRGEIDLQGSPIL
ncbi:hypothetical protein JCM5350_000077 [Sporobolomyces pararoseus]